MNTLLDSDTFFVVIEGFDDEEPCETGEQFHDVYGDDAGIAFKVTVRKNCCVRDLLMCKGCCKGLQEINASYTCAQHKKSYSYPEAIERVVPI